MSAIQDHEQRGQPLPAELLDRAHDAVESRLGNWFRDYDALIANGNAKTVDLGRSPKNSALGTLGRYRDRSSVMPT